MNNSYPHGNGLILMTLLSMVVGSAFAAQSDYPGYITRAYKSNTSFLNAEGWSDGRAPHEDANYYSANVLSAPSTTNRFDGNTLVLEGGKAFTLSGDELTFIGDGLVLGEGTQLYVNKTASLGGGLSGVRINGAVSVRGKSSDDTDFYKRDIVQGSGTGNMGLELTGSLSAAEGCELFVERLCGLGGYYADRTKSPRASGASGVFTLRISGDTTGFCGAIVVETNAFLQLSAAGLPNGTVELGKYGSPELSLAPTYSGLAGGLSLYGTAEASVGTLVLRGGKATIPAGGTLTVGTLKGEGGVIEFADTMARLTLTDGIELSSPVMLSVPVSYDYSSNAGFKYNLVRLAGTAAETVRVSDFVFDKSRVSVTGSIPADHRHVDEPRVQLVIESADEGSKIVSLQLLPVVTATGTGGLSSLAFSGEGSASYWNDGNPVHGGAEYLVCSRKMTLPAGSNVFPGNSLMFASRLAAAKIEISGETASTTISNLVVGSGDRVPNNYSFTVQAWNHDGIDDETLGSSGTTRLKGLMTILPWTTNVVFQPYSKTMLKVESDIVSAEDTTLHLTVSTTVKVPISFHELTGDNSAFKGRLDVGADITENSNVGCLVPSSDFKYGVTLVVSDGNSLGGARPSFTYDAFAIRNYATVRFPADVTVDEATRGWLVKNENRVVVEEGRTATLAVPVTFDGTLRKAGPGRLALGGRALFGDGELATQPVAGRNRLLLDAGSVQPLGTNVMDGVDLVVGADASIVLDYNTADAGLMEFGLYNVRGALSGSGDAPIRFVFEGAADDGEARAVCTVSKNVALAVANRIRVERPSGHRVPVKGVTTGDLVTFVADFRKQGLLLLFK